MSAISKYLCRNLFIEAVAQIRAVYKDDEIPITLKRRITLSLIIERFAMKYNSK